MRQIFLLIIILIGIKVTGQTITFSYDATGNRTQRIKVTKSQVATLADTVESIQGINSDAIVGNWVINIYPNPTADGINISCSGNEENAQLKATFLNTKGEVLRKFAINRGEQYNDLSDMPSGLYFIRIESRVKTEQWRVIKN